MNPTISPQSSSPSEMPSVIPSTSPSVSSPTVSPTTSPTQFTLSFCGPQPSLNFVECQQRIQNCANSNLRLKWSGTGSRVRMKVRRRCRNVKVGDGGCQCQSYCGYLTEKVCNRDPLCEWKRTGGVYPRRSCRSGQHKGACFTKGSDTPSGPIELCTL